MTVYYINAYDITDPELFARYAPGVLALLRKYGAEVLASDTEGIAVEGAPRKMNAIIQFPSEEAAMTCYNDPEYQPLKSIRQRATANCTMVLVKAFQH
ncbi:DUF1330 domain-containing protein [Chitinophaga barathri]|uniref:DUF1330 domain-containing protein n=1 Tax=Chitinophaga barathri TaxID=1647451 RepID=A0A3N4MEE3_9BACT|nr:DUF1330 domain-containing protein [Chitinophaga barathri]RPD39987.1 DUF1330 domain-containing protein [Chitinophaga barathri]